MLLSKPEQIVALESGATPAWIHPNADEAGYYRWSVPGAIFMSLAADAGRVLDTRERVGFLGNASALLAAGQLRGEEYVRVLETFAADPDPEVVGNVLAGLTTIRETFFTKGREAEFVPFVRRTLAPALDRFGSEKRKGEPETVTVLRPKLLQALGDGGRDLAVLTAMERLATRYLADPGSVDPSLLDVAIELSAIRGDATLFALYGQRFEAAKAPTERRRFLSALGNFRDPALADRALAYVFTGPLRPQEVLAIPRAMAAIPSEQGRAFAWMTAHYDQIAKRLPPDFMVFLPRFAEGCSAARVDAAKAFFAEPGHAPPGTGRELAHVEEAVGDCVFLDAREGESVRRYTTDSR